MTWPLILQSLVGLLAILNPVGAVPIYLSMMQGRTAAQRRHAARAASVTVAITLLVFLLVGAEVLEFFGVSLSAFRVGGGILLLTIGITLLHGQLSPAKLTPEEAEESADFQSIAIVPLAVPLIAGPGAMSTVIVLTATTRSWGERLALGGVILVAAAAVFATLLAAEGIQRVLGRTGITVIGRVMGLLLTAIAVQFMADGLVELFPALRTGL